MVTLQRNNSYILDDVLRMDNIIEYQTIAEQVDKKLLQYFSKTYKKLKFQDFYETNDYYIHRIKLFQQEIKKQKHLDMFKQGVILQNYILSIEKPIVLANDYKLVKSAISKSFLMDKKRQIAMIQRLEVIDIKSKENCDYVLLNEKLCFLIKAIFEVNENKKKNQKYQLYNIVDKLLTLEKFLQERTYLYSTNKSITVKGTKRTDYYNIAPETTRQFLPVRRMSLSKSFDQEIHVENSDHKHDNVHIFEIANEFDTLENQILPNPEENDNDNDNDNDNEKPQDTKTFYTIDPIEPKETPFLTNVEAVSVINGKPPESPSHRSHNNYNYNNYNYNPQIYQHKHKCEPLTSQLFYENFRTMKSIKKLEGDNCKINEIDEEELSQMCGGESQCVRVDTMTEESNNKEKEIIINNQQRIPPLSSERTEMMKLINYDEEENGQSKSTNIMERLRIKCGTTMGIRPRMINEVMNGGGENVSVEIPIGGEKKFRIVSDEKSPIQIPPNYTTDDPDLKLLCDLINEPPSTSGWAQAVNEKSVSIFKKSIPGCPTIIIKTTAVIDGFSKDEVFEAISDVDIRKNWDTVFCEFKIADVDKTDGNEILYTQIKSPSIWVSDRDFVQKRKIWRNFPTPDSNLLHFKSVVCDKCPLVKKVVRADTKISGYFMKTISVNPLKTALSIITQTDVKGSIPTWLVNAVAQKAPKEWVNNLRKGCEKVRANKK